LVFKNLALSIAYIFWFPRVCLLFLSESRTQFIKDAIPASPAPGAPLPKLAVIVPALNEEAEIRNALASLARQDYPDLRIYPINDRSEDRTGELMDETAREYPRLRPIHVRELPPRWIGKNHANWLGAKRAIEEGAEWLLFTDGDILFSESALRKAIAFVRERRLKHLAMMPDLKLGGFWETVFLTTFAVWLTTRFPVWNIESERSRQFMGVGAFNLVEVDAYQAIGTHERLALTVADDVALGKLVKRAGFRSGFADGKGEVKVRWQPSLAATVRGLYKSTFASMDFSLIKTAISIFFIFVLNVYVYLLPAILTGWRNALAWFALACCLFTFGRTARLIGTSLPVAVGIACCAWFGGALFVWLMIASAWITLARGGVTWRGTFYPSRLLRKNQVRI
jgi:glycosyltransferase involved in cell wall biosynthesis